MKIRFKPLEDKEFYYKEIYEWCQNESVYEWFEQGLLSYNEIVSKYKNKIVNNEQDVFIINYNNEDIGLFQIYKFNNDKYLKMEGNIYEYDIFIGVEKYLSKGLGTIVVNKIDSMIFNDYKASKIILRPFKKNIRGIGCYKKCGYKEIKEYLDKDTIGNIECYVVMEKKINN